MGQTFDEIDESMADWVEQQKLFFVATAPRSEDGLVNCSPKGLNAFRILDPTTVAYLDLTGSGIETAAHVKENGRIVIMFCAFEGPPKIVRFHGRGQYLDLESEDFGKLKPGFDDQPGIRGIVKINLTRISDSCGWGVPKFDYMGERDALINSAVKKGELGLADYRKEKNSNSLDGLPGY